MIDAAGERKFELGVNRQRQFQRQRLAVALALRLDRADVVPAFTIGVQRTLVGNDLRGLRGDFRTQRELHGLVHEAQVAERAIQRQRQEAGRGVGFHDVVADQAIEVGSLHGPHDVVDQLVVVEVAVDEVCVLLIGIGYDGRGAIHDPVADALFLQVDGRLRGVVARVGITDVPVPLVVANIEPALYADRRRPHALTGLDVGRSQLFRREAALQENRRGQILIGDHAVPEQHVAARVVVVGRRDDSAEQLDVVGQVEAPVEEGRQLPNVRAGARWFR